MKEWRVRNAGPSADRRGEGRGTAGAVLVVLVAVLVAGLTEAGAAGARAVCERVQARDNATTLAGCGYTDDSVDPVTRARRFIDANLGALKMAAAGSADLVHVETREGLAGRHVRFQEFLFGYPVFNAFVTAHEDRTGTIRRLHSAYRPYAPAGVPGRMTVTQDDAETIARNLLVQHAGRIPEGLAARRARQLWFPREDGSLALAWELLVTADRPALDYRIVVDRATGEVLRREDRLQRWVIGLGKVFRPNPIQASGDGTLDDGSSAQVINGLTVNGDLPGLAEGTGKTKGRFADTSVPSLLFPQMNYPVADEPTRQYFYDVADLRFAQVNAYYAIDSAQRYLRALGYSGDRTVKNGIRDYPTIVYPHWDAADNSFYRPTTDTLHFGEGGVPDAEDADIMVHEYGHAIQHAQNAIWGTCSTSPLPYGSPNCEMKAMAEGFSDYFAAVVHASYGDPAYQQSHAPCVGEWDSSSYVARPPYPPCLRRVDGSKVYPADLTGNIHADGEIWSRALWDIRNAIGGNVASQIVVEHQFSIPVDATMPQAALEMIAVDADLFGGHNEIPLRQAFCARGILAGSDCMLPTNATVVVPAWKDALIRQSATNRNEGWSPLLRLKGGTSPGTRLLLAFDLSGIVVANVKSAVLELRIADSDASWGIFGRTIDVHALDVDFVEGNGVQVGADPAAMTLGTGTGATWNCPDDTDISNSVLDCTSPWPGGGTYPSGTPLPPVVQTNTMTSGRVRWAVTDDVKAGKSRWLVKKTAEDKPGRVDYYSNEGALALDPYDTAGRRPRLIITYN